MIIQGEGYTFNTETRKLEFGEKKCWRCDGTGISKHYPACPHYGKPVNKFEGRRCPHCGCKNKHSHGRMVDENGNKVVVEETCYTCKGTGMEKMNLFSSLDFRPLEDCFEFVLIENARHTFNDQYIGLGNLSGFGVTAYTAGRFSTVEACVNYAFARDGESQHSAFRHLQAGNICNEDGYVPEIIYIKTHNNGRSFTGLMIGTKFGR